MSGCTPAPAPSPAPTPQRRVVITTSPQAAATTQPVRSAASAPQAGASQAGLPQRTGPQELALPSPVPQVSAPALRLPSDGVQVVLVDSTGGDGVWIRKEPAGDPVKIWPDGAPMLVVGEDRQADGRTWRHVKTLDGVVGWVAADYLFPSDPSMLETAAASLGLAPDAPRAGSSGSAPAVQARIPTNPQGQAAVAPPVPAARQAPAAKPTAPPPPTAPPTVPPTATTPPPTAVPPTATTTPTSTPQPTATPAPPTPTPIRAPAGATSMEIGSTSLAVVGTERGVPLRIGNRPRSDMELLVVRVAVTNRDAAPLAVYRGAFRLALSDRTRAEPLAGGDGTVPYSENVEPGGTLTGTLIFEVPIGTRADGIVWAPERDVTYQVGI